MRSPPMVDEPDIDDWAPLTAEQLAMRPGEQDHPRQAPVSPRSTNMRPVAPMPERKKVRAPNPRGEQMLRELQERLAKAGTGDSLIAHVQHREQRDARKQQAAKQSAPELAACVVRGEASPDEPAGCEVDYAVGPDGRDEREESEWFQALPQAEQDRLHQAWARKRSLLHTASVTQRRIGNRRMVAAWVSALLVVALGSRLFWHATLGAGVVCGFWWRHSAADRMLDPLRGIATMVVVQGIVMAAQAAYNPGMMMDCVLVAAFGALVGYDGEIRRTGGFDVMAK